MNTIPNTHHPIAIPAGELKTLLVGLGKVLPKHSTLPLLGCVLVQRDSEGWTTLTVSDLDRAVSVRLEAPAQRHQPSTLLVPFSDLQRLSKACPAEEIIEVEAAEDAEHVVLRHRLGHQSVEEKVTSFPVDDFPPIPQFTARPAMLDEAAKATLLNALSCASDDVTRTILQGVYLDVTDPVSHYVVATNGRCLFSSNSVNLPIPSSVLIPNHRFITWGAFTKDGPWQITVQEPKKGTSDSGVLRLESRRWTFITRQIEGTFPNWRTIQNDNQKFTLTINLSGAAAEELLNLLPRLPGADTPTKSVGMRVENDRFGRYLEYVFPEPKEREATESEWDCLKRDRAWSHYFFDQGAGNRLKGVEGTLWAAYNGVTEWMDHRKVRQSADQRLSSIWFGEANRVKARALTVAVEMLPHFRN